MRGSGCVRLSVCLPVALAFALSGCKAKQQPSSAPGQSSAANVAARSAANVEGVTPAAIPAGNLAAASRPSGPITFSDVAAEAGIHFRHNNGAFGKKYLPETMGSGVCVIDYDNDGWSDLFFVNGTDWPGHKTHHTIPALYHNNHDGTFTDVTSQAGLGLEMYGLGCAVGDYDNDGNDDLYITAIGGSRLFRNLGNGHFADVTAKAGVADSGFPASAVWFDYDRDGRLDLYVAHYVEWTAAKDQFCSLDGTHKSYCTPERYKGESARLFHNMGNGRFEDVTKKAGLYDPTSKSLGIALVDLDNDGWLSLFVTNDTQPNKLWKNNHNGTFTDQAFAAGVAYNDAGKARAGMGTDAGDYDGSGRQSLVIGNFTNESLSLYQNQGAGLFLDQAIPSGIAEPSARVLTFGLFFFDYDLDGLPDLFAADGHVADDISVLQPSLHYAEPPLVFRNRGGGKFENVTAKAGAALQSAMVARGAASLDYDNDGDLDVAVNVNNGPARLLRNDNGNRNDMLRVRLAGTKSNRDAIGARVTVAGAGVPRQVKWVKSGSSYLSQSEFPLTFGLGKPAAGKTVSVDIVWPSGRREALAHVAADQFITVEEGKGIVRAQPIQFTLTTKR
ncbi:MAG TPA: CRTAC1 family protein [Acidobacteriaceae bacterium]|nr:CRTAC1 family protein [Acidobacteriaceae bacterium]